MSRPIAKSWTEWLGQDDLGLNEIKPPKTKLTLDEMSMLVGEIYKLFQLVNELGLGHTAIEKRSDMEENVFSRAIFIRDQILKPENQHYAHYGFPVTTPLWDEWAGGLYAQEPHEWELDPRNDNREELLQAFEESKNLTPSEELQRTIRDLHIEGFHSLFYIN